MKQVFYILILIAMLVALAGRADGARTIRIRSSATVMADAVLLGDVADVEADSEGLRDQLLNLSVAQIRSGESVSLVGPYEIAEALSGMGVVPASFCIYGASRCEVTFLSVNNEPVIEVEATMPILEDRTAEEVLLLDLSQRLKVRAAEIMGLAAESLTADWRWGHSGLQEALIAGMQVGSIEPRSPVNLGRVQFAVTLTNDAGAEQEFLVTGQIGYLCRSVVAMRSMSVGEVIRANDVRVEIREVTNFNDVGTDNIEQVVNQEVSRSIRSNQIVTLDSIRKLQLIARRDIVEVIHRVGSIHLRFQGQALNGGGLGDLIQVHNPNNDTIVEGRITGLGEVTVGMIELDQASGANIVSHNTEQVLYLER